MKIVTLFGSPRADGNTATLAKTFNKTAEALGADVQTFFLNKLDTKGCQACDACKTKTDHCVVKDDLEKVLESVRTADVLVAATPIYFADISAQFKIFVDRCYSYLEPFETIPETTRLKPGKKFVLITAQNRGEDIFAEVCTKYRMIFQSLGFQETHLIRGCDLRETDALKTKNRQDLIELSKETAKKVVESAV
ncbi:MAG: flavodoxin family protein [Deltaproteobacteria bacterium]|jgi:multimeric flavodoxin WrbA